MAGQINKVHSIAIFASGTGTNAEKIIKYKPGPSSESMYRVDLIVCNKPGAGVLKIADDNQVETLLVEKEKFFSTGSYVNELKSRGIEFIVLAGFLWKIPSDLIKAYPHKIINIHPALLPKYGGKGMYGDRVHETVLAARERESGITIHYVDEIYDNGQVIFQAKCSIDEKDTPTQLAQKIHALEHRHYPEVIEQVLQMQN